MTTTDTPYDLLYSGFHWDLPARFNIAEACADIWARDAADRICLIEDRGAEPALTMSYGELARRSARVAAAFAERGVKRGDRVAIVLPQSFETVIVHLAVYRLGAIAVPLALRFGPEALEFRLHASSAKLVVIDANGLPVLEEITGALPDLTDIVTVGEVRGDLPELGELERAASGAAPIAETTPDDPAMIIFTSGTTGPPKGALHGHRVLLGHLPGMRFHHENMPQPRDRMWTPADWAWAGGLLNALLPSLLLGVPVVYSRERFDPAAAFTLMARQKVRNAFLPATALRMMKGAANAEALAGLDLRTVGSAGETLPADTFAWARDVLGVTVNEFYGQTECNMVLGSAAAYGVSRAGAIGKPVPGHKVAIVDSDGREVPRGVTGTIAIAAPDPVMFLGYWQNPKATSDKFSGDWLLTGDQGQMDTDGYVEFVGRDDDIITSAGYRIGPGEVENCLLAHPAVHMVAVVGKPDPLRTEIVKAYIVPAAGHAPSEDLARAIQLHVRKRLSAHEYPREIAFVDAMPLTTSGKIVRREFRDRAAREAQDAAKASAA